jgi:steroid 5-alpha reductase family enzyme
MSPLSQTLLTNLMVIMLAMFALWVVGTFRRDASIVDPFWGAGFVIVGWISWCANDSAGIRSLLLAGLTTIWGLRLSLFLLWRNWGHAEDRRYGAMRERHGQRFWWVSLFTVFWLQGLILWFVSFPLQFAAANQSSQRLGWLDGLGVAIWAIGLVFETVGDWQLARFQADPANAGRVMDRGLWHYTRHPNYFGDFCVWWGLYLIALAGGASWTIVSPILMSILLMKVSGVTLLESTITDRRPDYAAYRARTNAFFPGIRRLVPENI